MSVLEVLAQFFAAALLIGAGGSRLSRSSAKIALATGLSGTWVGMVLLATVTSLPELITGVSAVGLVRTPDIAVGAILGSCVFNLVVLVVVDFMLDRESLYTRVGRDHILSAGYGVVLIGAVAFGLMVEREGFAIGHVGATTPLILVVYGMALRSIYQRESRAVAAQRSDGERPAKRPLALYAEFGGAAAVVVAGGIWLPFVGLRMVDVLGIHETFIGTIFVACATSLPEMVVAAAAVRIGAPNMAVSNLLGSNLFNVLILVPEDLLLTSGPILAAAAPVNALSAISAVVMSGVAIVALLLQPRGSRFGGVSVVLMSIYLINSYLVFLYRG